MAAWPHMPSPLTASGFYVTRFPEIPNPEIGFPGNLADAAARTMSVRYATAMPSISSIQRTSNTPAMTTVMVGA